MHNHLRAVFLIGALGAGGGATLALDACANFMANLPQYATDAADIAAGLTTVVGDLKAAKAIPAQEAATLDVVLVDVNTEAGALAKQTNVATAKGTVNQLAADVSTLLGATSGITNLSAADRDILDAVQTLLPVVEASVGIVVPAAAAQMSMTPEQARAVLAHARS